MGGKDSFRRITLRLYKESGKALRKYYFYFYFLLSFCSRLERSNKELLFAIREPLCE